MESIFKLSEGDRTAYLHQMSYSFGCTYICVWSYVPHPSNCLVYMDGVYNEDYIKRAVASSSSASTTSLPSRLFYVYQQSVLSVDDGRVPGIAFSNSIPYLEYKGLELQTLASTEVQQQFYQEARIKTCVFMGCKIGEIELGFSIDSQVNVEAQMKNLFPQDFLLQVVPRELTQPIDQTVPPPFSPSLMISLPIHSSSTAPSPFINVASTSPNPNPTLQQPLAPSITSSPSTNYDLQETIDTLNQIRNVNFPTIESEDAAITQAILAVISSSTSPSPNSSPQPQQRTSAFKSYSRSALAPSGQITRRVRRPNMLKQAVEFIRSTSSLMRGQERIQIGSRSASNQLQHMIKERRRRERLNENFEALKSLLPPGSKKDKASVLNSTLEYMNLLIAEVQELSRRNQMLLSQQHDQADTKNNQEIIGGNSSSSSAADDHRLDIRLSNVAETTSEARILDLRVRVRGECSVSDITVRVLEFLRQVANVGLLSVEAGTQMVETTPVSAFVWRLKIEGDENWEESTFLEAVRRVIADLAQ